MKTLYLVRHAKSSWSFDLKDHDRPLGQRGRKDAIKMGKFVRENVPEPELIITSTASRAFYTALHLADGWEYPENKIILSGKLFHCSLSEIGEILNGFGNTNTIAIFGHNPGFTDFNNLVSEQYILNIPTCGIVGLQFDTNSWKNIMNRTAQPLFFYTPKGIRS